MSMMRWPMDFERRRARWLELGEPPTECVVERVMWIRWRGLLCGSANFTVDDARLYYVERLMVACRLKVAAAARTVGVPASALRDWLKGLRPLPDHHAMALDAALLGQPDFDVPAFARGNWPPGFVDE